MIQTWKMAWSAVCANKLRTFLTMLGIIIGVAALIILVSIADGAGDSVSGQISEMGSNYLSVRITDQKENPLQPKAVTPAVLSIYMVSVEDVFLF